MATSAKTVPNLPDAAAISDTDLFVVTQGDAIMKKTPASALKTYTGTGGGGGGGGAASDITNDSGVTGATVKDALDTLNGVASTAVQSVVAGTNVTVDNSDPLNPVISSAGSGEKGDTGPAALTAIAPWATGVFYGAGPPASFVSQGGSSYACLEDHTSGTFATDLAAGKWGLVAAKGADGDGAGDMIAANNLSDLTDDAEARGNLGLGTAATHAATDFATAAQGAKADTALQSVVAGTGITVDDTDPLNPVITASAAGLSDTDRRNMLLDRIYQSKLFGGYRRFINAFADGYKATDGIDLSSVNVDTSNAAASGYVLPSLGIGSQFGQSAAAYTASKGTGSGTLSSIFQASIGSWQASTAGIPSRVSFDLGSGVTSNCSEVILNWHYAGTKTGTIDYSDDGSTWVNAANFSVTAVVDTDVTVAVNRSDAHRYWSVNLTAYSGSTVTSFQKAQFFSASTNNMTLVTAAQTSGASVSNGRVLIEYDASASPTLNTDLTAEVTCDGGAHWTSASLSSVTTHGQGGRSVAETVDQACTAGTSFAARIKTANNKSVPIYGLSFSVH